MAEGTRIAESSEGRLYRALLIGCGNIGALYDLDSLSILTHAKAYSKSGLFELNLFDTNRHLATSIASRYGCSVVDEVTVEALKEYDSISICTPTTLHCDYLKMVIESAILDAEARRQSNSDGCGILGLRPIVIICEKPVSGIVSELDEVTELYVRLKQANPASHILVNYFRRFQPAFGELKEVIRTMMSRESLTNVAIRYQRGFNNNASHAFDLIEYLTDERVALSEVKLHNIVPDHFENDPTLSLHAQWRETRRGQPSGINVNVMGLGNVRFSHFEVELYFEYSKVLIGDSGNVVTIFQAEKETRFLQPLHTRRVFCDCIKNYMAHVVEHAASLLRTSEQGLTDGVSLPVDNFIHAVSLNREMLRLTGEV